MGVWSAGAQYDSKSGVSSLGLTADAAVTSATEIVAAGNTTDGTYWINLPTVGAKQIYCILNPAYDGGGWMMMMKATTGTTFSYGSTHWTTTSTLNPTDTTRGNADAKFDTMNYFLAKDMLAVWPDIPQGGSIAGLGAWIWLQNNFNGGSRITPIAKFSGATAFIGDAKTYSGWATGVFSSQTDVRFYGYNFNQNRKSRWGFGWNENGGGLYPNGYMGSEDVAGGIGLGNPDWSAGDAIGCCNDSTGINRQARVEVYVR